MYFHAFSIILLGKLTWWSLKNPTMFNRNGPEIHEIAPFFPASHVTLPESTYAKQNLDHKLTVLVFKKLPFLRESAWLVTNQADSPRSSSFLEHQFCLGEMKPWSHPSTANSSLEIHTLSPPRIRVTTRSLSFATIASWQRKLPNVLYACSMYICIQYTCIYIYTDTHVPIHSWCIFQLCPKLLARISF